MKYVTNLDAEPIDPELRACINEVLAIQPGARVIKRKEHLFLKAKNGFEILCQHLYQAKRQWIEAGVEHADLPDEQKWIIFNLLLARDDARLEEVPGIGLKVTLPAQQRH